MKPPEFQFIVLGWVRPSLLVQRTMTDRGPAGAAISGKKAEEGERLGIV